MGIGSSVNDTTFLYCRPDVLGNPLGAAEVDEVLEGLICELDLDRELELRPANSNAISIPTVGPEEAWAAIDRLVPMWKQARLFFLPRLSFGHGH
jgi:hypothetical protein